MLSFADAFALAATAGALERLGAPRDGLDALRTAARATAGFLPALAPLDLDDGAPFFFGADERADVLAFVGFFGVIFATGIPHFSQRRPRTPGDEAQRGRVSEPTPDSTWRALRRWKAAARVESGTTLSIKCVPVNGKARGFGAV
jgi:hypothetical protein